MCALISPQCPLHSHISFRFQLWCWIWASRPSWHQNSKGSFAYGLSYYALVIYIQLLTTLVTIRIFRALVKSLTYTLTCSQVLTEGPRFSKLKISMFWIMNYSQRSFYRIQFKYPFDSHPLLSPLQNKAVFMQKGFQILVFKILHWIYAGENDTWSLIS